MSAVARSFVEDLTGVARPCVRGKFIFIGEEKFYVRGVTYGTFRPGDNGDEFPLAATVDRDFARMAASGINAVRTYTVPPRWLLDCADVHGLRVMVGLPVERYVGFLNDGRRAPDIEALVRDWVRCSRAHPSLLCYAIGNEIPAPVVRWHGRRRIERYIERLYRVVKDEDPDAIVTYVSYPSTEYLRLPFMDLVCFNTYLESQERLEAYLARLQNLAGDRPLVMSELGLDGLRHGEDTQATVLAWQIRSAFACGCAGAFVYAWTDEWYRGGAEVDDWQFGLTRRDRGPKVALRAVSDAFARVPLSQDEPWPRVSVIICTYNGAKVIADALEALRSVDYPDFEVIVVDDGSSDATAAIVEGYGYRVIRTPNRGLGRARNTGLEAATGELVAYIDDDAYPDPHWLRYLAASFVGTDHAAVGGPNIAPPGDGPIADCVANAPGNPTHVLLSDRIAEHIPGCNMAFRKKCLQAIGGFDPQFRVAGDDVDVCWRLQEQGWTLGYNPAAMVWHHRRNSVRAFWKQQVGYGRAEALLERKWPAKYNAAGHPGWSGRLYGNGIVHALARPSRIYYGVWGSAAFQSLCESPAGALSLPAMPEWYLLILALGALSVLGAFWKWSLLAVPLLAAAVALSLFQAAVVAKRARFPSAARRGATHTMTLRCLTAFLNLLQPLARLRGRLAHGLTPWRPRGAPGFRFPRPRTFRVWTERWEAPEARLRSLETGLRANRGTVRRGGVFDRWDIEVVGGLFGAARTLMLVEEHGAGCQLVRVRAWPKCSSTGLVLSLLFAALSALAAVGTAWHVSAILGTVAAAAALWILRDCATALNMIFHMLTDSRSGPG